MGRIPQTFIDELMARVDIVEVIESRLALRKQGNEYAALCPFHSEKTPSFTVSPRKQFFHCFGCGAHGTALGFLMDYEHLDFVEAVEELARRVGLEVPREAGGPAAKNEHGDLYAIMEQAASFYCRQLREHPQRQRAIDYLKGRGLTGEIVRDFGIGFAPGGWDALLKALGNDQAGAERLVRAGLVVDRGDGRRYDRFRDRIIFPIRDRRGRVVAFGGRVLGDGEPKYLNSPETPIFHKGRELYGLYEARRATRRLERLAVVEGYMDVVALAQSGIPYAVATLGTATTGDHLERLFRTVDEVVFCFDGDRAGRAAAWRALQNALPTLREGREARFLFLPEGEDPDSLVRREGAAAFEQRLRENGVPISTFFFEEIADGVDTTSVDGRARLVERARPYLAKLPEGVYRDMMVQHLAEMARMPAERVAPEAAGEGRSEAAAVPTRRRTPAGRRMRSPVRHAVALLVQNPGLAALAPEPRALEGLDRPGIPLLIQLLELLHGHPHLTTSALLERWRGTDEGRHLARLTELSLPLPPEGLEEEFRQTVEHLRQRAVEQRWQALLEKPFNALTDQEKAELRAFQEARAKQPGTA